MPPPVDALLPETVHPNRVGDAPYSQKIPPPQLEARLPVMTQFVRIEDELTLI
jgi:hypothetical protein